MVGCLPSMNKSLGLSDAKKPIISHSRCVVHMCNPCTQKVDVGRIGLQDGKRN